MQAKIPRLKGGAVVETANYFSMQEILFYLFSGIMLACGLLVITSRNPVNSAMFLVLAFFFMAGLFVLLHAFFLAAVQVLVYAGAVMVLFLFVIMLMNVGEEPRRKIRWLALLGAGVVGVTLIAELISILWRANLGSALADEGTVGSTAEVGRLLFRHDMLPFEVASVVLLAAMVGVIVLSRKEKAS